MIVSNKNNLLTISLDRQSISNVESKIAYSPKPPKQYMCVHVYVYGRCTNE